jgi:hypothetical protein
MAIALLGFEQMVILGHIDSFGSLYLETSLKTLDKEIDKVMLCQIRCTTYVLDSAGRCYDDAAFHTKNSRENSKSQCMSMMSSR